MFSRLRKTIAIVPTVFALTMSFAGIGCGGGESASSPTPAASESAGEKPKGTTSKKSAKGVESEENTPKRFQDKN